ncbi:lipopolysaccharide heptosyltransferase I [Granulicella arctica]|uniref:lipopolysaccharide heptosyltransferase I n=1 Tax=Granulicella arctica TaxID=940613 RepID=UPI0021DFA74F|nr:lipopolysaccharide heptosyltransferase I [Granulicella arctica]
MSLTPNTSSDTASAFRVLIVRTGAMGDVLHAMPAVAAMRLKHPDWHIGWAIEPRWRSLLEGDCALYPMMPLVDHVHNVPTRSWNQRPFSQHTAHEILRLRRELQADRYDLCVDMQGLLRSAVVGWLAKAGEFVGTTDPRETPARWFYDRRIVTRAPHVIDRGCQLLGGAIGETLTAAPVPLPVDKAAEKWCDGFLAGMLANPTQRFAFLAPMAGWGSKRWPVEKYGALAKVLADAGICPLINVAAKNDPVAAAVVLASGGVAKPVDCTMAQLTSLLRRVSIVIAGDTGPLHLAAALGRPVVGLYGPTDPQRTGPYGTRSKVIRHPSSVDDRRRSSSPEVGLMKITVEEVAAAAFELAQGEAEGSV